MVGATVPIASADIYFWTDENGVKNFTNYSPPEKAEVFMKTPEAGEETSLLEAETDRPGDADRALESEQLQAATEEIEALREQVGELKDRFAALPEAPSFESGGAANEAEELLGEERLETSLKGAVGLDLRQIIHEVQVEIRAHAGDTPQDDDVTMVALQRLP